MVKVRQDYIHDIFFHILNLKYYARYCIHLPVIFLYL